MKSSLAEWREAWWVIAVQHAHIIHALGTGGVWIAFCVRFVTFTREREFHQVLESAKTNKAVENKKAKEAANSSSSKRYSSIR